MDGLRGVILAGGASRRMGRDKAAIEHAGTSFLSHTTSLLEAVGASPVVVLGRPDLPNGLPDQVPLAGPAAALLDYLASMPAGSRHLVVPVDMPDLTTTALSRLADQQDWSFFSNHMLPMLAIAGILPKARPERLRDLLSLVKARQISVSKSDQDRLVNLNTPEDLKLWRQHAPQCGVREHV